MIELYLKEIEKNIKLIREELHGFGLSAHREGDKVIIEWDGEIDEIQWDIEGDKYTKSLQKMWKHPDYDPPQIDNLTTALINAGIMKSS